jgi:hypothetical protein
MPPASQENGQAIGFIPHSAARRYNRNDAQL